MNPVRENQTHYVRSQISNQSVLPQAEWAPKPFSSGMKNVVVLGAGFGGIRAALEASKRLPSNEWQVIIVDKRTFHTFSPTLYEAATAYSSSEPKPGAANRDFDSALAEAVCIPLKEIFRDSAVQVVHDEIVKIDAAGKQIETKNGGIINYEFCISALGSEPFFFAVEGAEINSCPLKTFDDALKIREKLRMIVNDAAEQKRHIVVVGGGPSGVEVIAEIACFIRKTCRECGIASQNIILTLAEAQGGILSGFNQSFVRAAVSRLKKFDVDICVNMHIARVSSESIFFDNGEEMQADLVLWGAGAQAPPVIARADLRKDSRGRIIVDNYLRAQGREDFFAIGDCALFFDTKKNMPAPGTACVAVGEGRVVAENIARTVAGEPLKPYSVSTSVYVSPVGGKYAVASVFGHTLSGFWMWVFSAAIDFCYYSSILSCRQALGLILRGISIFSRNDE